ncbi:MAG TPA: potassium channel protein [Candidatus Polarisedimenticolaceae bacterium]
MRKRLAIALGLLAGVLAVGTLGYVLIEGASPWDAFYMTAITLTTVGYGEVFPLSRAGEVFTVVVLFAGLGILLFGLTDLARWVIEGEMRDAFGRRRRTRMLEKLSGHEIVCGWGRMGQAVVEELVREGRPFVVIERAVEKVARLTERGVPVVEGDAVSEDVLKTAGVARARGLVACLNDDAHNVYTVLTARSLNPSLFIVARAGEAGADARLRRAGANKVVNPYHLGGLRLAHMLTKPAVVDFLDVSFDAEGGELQLEQLQIDGGTPISGTTLAGADLRRKWGVAVVGVKRAGRVIPNPEADFRLQEGDVLIVAGARAALESFERAMLSPA